METENNKLNNRVEDQDLSDRFPIGTKVVVIDRLYCAPGTWVVIGTLSRLVVIENNDQKRVMQLFESSIQIIEEESSSN